MGQYIPNIVMTSKIGGLMMMEASVVFSVQVTFQLRERMIKTAKRSISSRKEKKIETNLQIK